MNVKNETHYLECSGVRIAFNGYDAIKRQKIVIEI